MTSDIIPETCPITCIPIPTDDITWVIRPTVHATMAIGKVTEKTCTNLGMTAHNTWLRAIYYHKHLKHATSCVVRRIFSYLLKNIY